jgi:hypothetical protein
MIYSMISMIARIRSKAELTNLPCIDWEVGIIERPIELLFSDGLISGVVVWSEIFVSQCFVSPDPLLRVEHKHLLEEVDGCLCQ